MIDNVWYDYSDLSTDYLSVMLWLLMIFYGQMLPYAGGRGASGGSVLAS